MSFPVQFAFYGQWQRACMDKLDCWGGVRGVELTSCFDAASLKFVEVSWEPCCQSWFPRERIKFHLITMRPQRVYWISRRYSWKLDSCLCTDCPYGPATTPRIILFIPGKALLPFCVDVSCLADALWKGGWCQLWYQLTSDPTKGPHHRWKR